MNKTLLTLMLVFQALLCLSQSEISTYSLDSAKSTTVQIPIDSNRWYQLDNVTSGLGPLFDGNLDEQINTGYGKVLGNYDSYYPVLPGEKMVITSMKLFDYEGDLTGYPLTISVITNTWQRIPVATYLGGHYNTWVGPNPDSPSVFTVNPVVQNVQYIVINAWYQYPAEIQFYGTYTAPSKISVVVKKAVPLSNFFGVNGFEWDFENPTNPSVIDTNRMNAAKSFTGLRHYMDWQKLEPGQDAFTYNPVFSGSWNYDTLYAACKAAGITVLADMKTIPSWIVATYPDSLANSQNTPVNEYGGDFTNPNSYLLQAQVAFQYIARYGSNPNVNHALLNVDDTPRWTNDAINQVKVGLGTIKYIECDNERDKWWLGVQAYQTGREYAANLSAFYDGNLNTMGPGVGVKNADPTVMVIMAGTASTTTDYVRGMIDWCKQYRGYKANGAVNLCWDVINYHLYQNNADSNSGGNPTRGVAPEKSTAAAVANNFIQMSHQYANDMPIWVTESGYDINQGSTQKAISVGNKTAVQTQADWILRTSLLYARSGVQKLFFYEMYDDDTASSGTYETCGLLNSNFTRRPAADYLYQANALFGKYSYSKTLSTNPFVDEYTYNGSAMYALVVPDEIGRTASYTLNLGNATSANIYTPRQGSNSMSVKTVSTVKGKLTLTVTETPVFVTPVTVAPKQIYALR